MVGKLLALLGAPFAVAVYCLLLLGGGAVGGYFVAQSMIASEAKHKAEAKAAAAAALLPPPPPARMRAPSDGASPFEPRYVSLGDEILSALDIRGRAVIVDLSLMTKRGEKGESLLSENRIPLRALAVAIISEQTVKSAKAFDAADQLALRLRAEFNETLRQKSGVEPVDQVIVKKFFVQ